MRKWLVSIWILLFSVQVVATNENQSRIVLITGASQGIGLATAELLAKNGYKVYGSLRQTSDKAAFLKAKEESNGFLEMVTLDQTDGLSIHEAVQSIIEKEGKIDILINNAGSLLFGSVENTSIEEAKELFDVNFFGVMRVLHEVLPYMRQQKSGHIVNVSSRAGFRPAPSLAIYSASKHALEAITETLAYNLEPFNIKVSNVQPGPVKTNMDLHAKKGTHLANQEDPYYSYFETGGLLLERGVSDAQDPLEVAEVILEAVQSTYPHLRYQTHEFVRKQAIKRMVDPTGDNNLEDLKTGLAAS